MSDVKRIGLQTPVSFAWRQRTTRPAWATRPRLLSLAGCCLLGVFAVFIILLVNFPPRSDLLFGVSHDAPTLFRNLWPYPTFAISPRVFRLAVLACVLGLWLAYAAAVAALPRGDERPGRRLPAVIGGWASALVLLLLLFMPPILSTDIYLYAIFGRMQEVYSLNPFLATARTVSGDMLYPYTVWRDVVSFYGPHWALVERWAAALAGDSLLALVFGFKLVAAVAHLANSALVYLICRRLSPGHELRALLLYAWNPLVLVESIGSAHNDVYMLTFVLAGLLFAIANRRAVAVAFIALSCLVKYVTGLLLIFVLVYWLTQAATVRERVRILLLTGAVSAAVALLFYLPFLAGVTSPLQLLAGGAALRNVLDNPARMLLGAAARQLGLGEAWLGPVLHGAFAVFLVWSLRSLARAGGGWPRLSARWGAAHLLYVLFVFGGFFPWYMVAPLAVGFLSAGSSEGRWLRAAALDTSLALMLLYGLVIEAAPVLAPGILGH